MAEENNTSTPAHPRRNRNAASTSQTAESSPPSKDRIRGLLGLIYVFSFLIIVAGELGFMLFTKHKVTDIKDILLATSAILSGPLGFIMGFYFKDELQKNNL